MIKYKAESWTGPRITKVEVDRETDSSVFIDGRAERKCTGDRQYFNTFDEAKSFLVDIFEQKASYARRGLEIANGKLGNARGLKE